MSDSSVSSFPPIVAHFTKYLPLYPLERLIAQIANRIAASHPEFFDRLDDYATKSFVIVPTDLDWIASLSFFDEKVQVRLSRSLDTFPNRDVTVSAPFLSLIDLLDGDEDGDALFFSRDLTIEGDTEAVLALRNAIDDAEIDIIREVAQMTGPLSGKVEKGGKSLLQFLQKSSLMRRKTSDDASADMTPAPGAYPG